MIKQKSARIVPRLRFAEFEEDGEWEFREIREVGDIVTGKTPNTKDDSLWNGSILFITPTDIHEQAKYQTSTQRKVVETKETKLLPPGSILYTCIASIGKIAITKGKSISNQQINSIITNSTNNNEFIYYCLLHLTPWIKSIPAASTLPIINKQEFSKIKIIITPNKKEQQKIAACLTALDDLISTATGRLDALKQHKQGLMQQLFPAQGETVPRLRFSEFRDAGEWKIKKLEKISKIVRGGSPRPIDQYLTNDEDGLNWLKIGDISKDSKYVIQTRERIEKTALAKTRLMKPGDLIMSNSMSFGRPYILKIKTCIHDGWIAITIDEDIDSDYLYYFILSDLSQTYFLNSAAGSGVKNLNIKIVRQLSIFFSYKKEQQKIAACLTALDDLISAQTQKIAKLKTHKRGLMQQLFPAIDETHR